MYYKKEAINLQEITAMNRFKLTPLRVGNCALPGNS
jgi:hypothetical protein